MTAGANATFSVSAGGTAPLTYQWSKRGSVIAGATGASYTTVPTSVADSGSSFTVVVRNSAGTATSQAATLTVTAKVTAPSITTQPQSLSVTAGASATFTVSATGSAPMTYQWSKGGAVISAATGASYTSAATTLSDSGATYRVTVTNAAGSATSQTATLTVSAASGSGTPSGTPTDITTYHNDIGRTGQNLTESTLTTGNVAQSTFGLKRKLPVDGKIDAQPLVLAGYTIAGAARTVVFVATEHDSVYAFDANTGQLLWHVSMLASGETPSDDRGCNQTTPEIGVSATPVIDRSAGSLFLVAMSRDGSGIYHQRLHALSLATGADLAGSPTTIAASVPATGAPNAQQGQLVFDPSAYKERSALLLSHGTIYTSWASHCDSGNYTGWILAYGESSLQQTGAFNDEPSGSYGSRNGEAAFWNANSGPSADSSGNVYAMSGNGVFDPVLTSAGFPVGNDYGNSIIKLAASGNALSVTDYFTMYDTVAESSGDVDLGSGGLMLLPDQTDSSGTARHLAVGAGKDQNIYVVNRDNMGKFNPANNSSAWQFLPGAVSYNSLTNCGSLPGDSGIFGAPVYFNGMVYFAAAGDVIRGYAVTKAQLATQSTTMSVKGFCYPGATLAISANGTANGILWAVENSASNGILHAYLASDLSRELYNSAQAGARDQFGPGAKFTPPSVADGLVFVGTQANPTATQNYLAVFGTL